MSRWREQVRPWTDAGCSIDEPGVVQSQDVARRRLMTALEQRLRDTLGVPVRPEPRPGADPGKRPIGRSVDYDPELLNHAGPTRPARVGRPPRRTCHPIENDHGRPPTRSKHSFRTAATFGPRRRAQSPGPWPNDARPRRRSRTVLDGLAPSTSMVQAALAPPARAATIADARSVSRQTAHRVLESSYGGGAGRPGGCRTSRAEAPRQVRTTRVTTERRVPGCELLVDEVLDRRSVALSPAA